MECFPETIAEELERPFEGVDTLIQQLDVEMALGNRKLENRMEGIQKSRLLLDRVNEALTVLKKKPENKDYPENKLSGAVFEVYRDTNGNKELDKDDELLGVMEETEKGQYEMKDVLFGGVLVKEKTAPDGFYLDENTYYVMIDTDGETYEIENEAGKGFYNEAFKGNLKIVKTSSDGRVEGFTFRVVGDNYDQTFKTDSRGEIFIENLRVGKYTVTEVEDSASAGYKRPDPVTVELVVDETLIINVHNDKITVDVPKTGDNSNLWVWISLMVLGVAGAGTTLVLGRKKRKNNQ